MTSYGFMYEVERGNIDLYALFFALLSVWLMLRLPRSPWWPAIVLAVSINLKLYPGVLLVLLFWRYRWRALLPAVVANAVLLLIAGPGNVRNTVNALTGIQAEHPRSLVGQSLGGSHGEGPAHHDDVGAVRGSTSLCSSALWRCGWRRWSSSCGTAGAIGQPSSQPPRACP